MEHEPSADGIAVAEIVEDGPQVEVVNDANDISLEETAGLDTASDQVSDSPTVDELEARLEVIESAMQQLQAGDIAAAEDALVVLDGEPS